MNKLTLKLYLPEMIFSVFFLLVYLPHFLFIGTPQILNDSFAYFFIAKDIFEGNLPLENYIIDLPTGYSFFIALIKKLGGDLGSVMIAQTGVFFLSFLFLVKQIKNLNWRVGLVLSVAIALFTTLSDIILMNTLLYTEALYMSCIVLCVAFLFKYFPEYPRKLAFRIVICTIFIILLRSNGIFILFLPIGLYLEGLFSKRQYKNIYLLAFVSNLLISSLINIPVKGYFAPGEIKRHAQTKVVKHMIEGDFLVNEDSIATDQTNKYTKDYVLTQAYKTFANAKNAVMGNHYYYRMPSQYGYIYTYDSIKTMLKSGFHFGLYLDVDNPKVDEYVNFLIDSASIEVDERNSVMNLLDIERRPRHPWLYSVHLIHFLRYIVRNPIVPLLFYITFFISLYNSIKYYKKKNNRWKLITLIGLIHITSMTLYSISVVRDEMLQRYCLVTEFTEYIVIIISFSFLIADYMLSKRGMK